MNAAFKAACCPFPLAVLLACCGSSSDPPPPAPPPPPPGPVAFDAFVLDLIQNRTTDDGEPVSLDGLEFEFDEDPAAFDVLFGGAQTP